MKTHQFLVAVAVCGLTGALLAGAPAAKAHAGTFLAQLTDEEKTLSQGDSQRESQARALLESAVRLEEKGELIAARLIYRDLLERFEGTAAAAEAVERLAAIDGRPDWGPRPPATRPPVPVTPPANETLRSSPTPVPVRANRGLDQSGRASVIIYSTLATTWTGLAIPIAANADNSTPYGLGLLLGAPAGLLASIYATRDRQVNGTQADIFVQGVHMGLWHGLAIGAIYDWDGEDIALSSAIGGLAGAGVATAIIAPGKNRESSASLAGLLTPYGAWFGLVAAQLFEGEGNQGSEDDELAAMLVGGDLALGGAIAMMKNITLSRSRARLIGVSGVVGTVIGGALDLIFQVDGKDAWLLGGAGTLGGLGAGVALTAEYDRDRNFKDPPRANLSAGEVEPELALLPMRPVLRASPVYRDVDETLRQRLDSLGLSQKPGFGMTLFEATF